MRAIVWISLAISGAAWAQEAPETDNEATTVSEEAAQATETAGDEAAAPDAEDAAPTADQPDSPGEDEAGAGGDESTPAAEEPAAAGDESSRATAIETPAADESASTADTEPPAEASGTPAEPAVDSNDAPAADTEESVASEAEPAGDSETPTSDTASEPAEEPPAESYADLPAPEADQNPFQPHAELRVIASQLSDFALDADGTTTGQGMWLDTRLRTGAEWDLSAVKFQGELDVLNGTMAGDLWTLEGTPDARLRDQTSALSLAGIRGRKLSAMTVLGNTQMEVGLVSSQWGLGIVANDGAVEPMFGRADFGDQVVRVRATKLPSGDGPTPKTSWLYTGALDLVVSDDISAISDDQHAMQGILSALGLGRRGSKFGVYGVFRQQWENIPGRTTQAAVVDVYVDATKKLGDSGWSLRTAAETAGIAGRTNKSLSYNARDNLGVISIGAAGIATLAGPDNVLQAHLLGAYASGDGNPDDGLSHDFNFDRDYGAGMVLFDEFGGAIEANSWRQLSDPALSGQPPDSVEALVTEGAFRKAAYIQPVGEVQPTPWSNVRAGVLFAFATAPVAHPFYSYRAGGVPTNHLNRPANGRLMGTELDWSMSVGHPVDTDGLRSSFTIQGGHLIPGSALQGPDAGMVHLVTAGIRAAY